MMNAMRAATVMVVAVLAGCTKRVNVCYSDADCKDPMYPFCDVNGEYPASGGEKNSCTIVPDNCPVDRCGCTPGAMLSCVGDQATTCAPDGMSTTMDTCALGCAADGTRCLTFDPSNGLGGALAMAAGEADVVVPAGATIDTDLGEVTDSNGVPIAVTTLVIPQTGAPSIRAFIGRSIVIDDTKVVGTNALALVAHAGVTVQGLVDLAAHGVSGASAAQTSPLACAGSISKQFQCSVGPATNTVTDGAGGGGDATVGGTGGGNNSGFPGGMAVQTFVPLSGGCAGGNLEDISGTLLSKGGGGGGAVEIVSLTTVSLTGRGFISLGGGGGAPSCGGGSGGTLIIEAPTVQLVGNTVGIVANGGAGGACGMNGADGTLTATPALAPSNCADSGGNGGTGSTGPGSAHTCTTSCVTCDVGPWGGGGGSVGRMRIATGDGTYVTTGSPIVSILSSAAKLTPL